MNEYNMAANNGLWVEAKKILMIFVLHMLVQIMQFKVLMGTNSIPPPSRRGELVINYGNLGKILKKYGKKEKGKRKKGKTKEERKIR